ncbi:PEGA domain-containing protein [Elusimicrobiota bacterium]
MKKTEHNSKSPVTYWIKKAGLLSILAVNCLLVGVTVLWIFKYSKPGQYPEIPNAVSEDKNKVPANIKVDSQPAGVKVFMDGYYRGRTPIDFKVTSVENKEEYKLTLIQQGYSKWERDITLYGGDMQEYNVLLEKESE